jgi:hypothetical protein
MAARPEDVAGKRPTRELPGASTLFKLTQVENSAQSRILASESAVGWASTNRVVSHKAAAGPGQARERLGALRVRQQHSQHTARLQHQPLQFLPLQLLW